MEPPDPALGLSVVIPCFNEQSLLKTLDSLWEGQRAQQLTEVLVVINDSETTPTSIKEQNKATLAAMQTWAAEHHDSLVHFYPLYCPDLPKKYAGVGLARKIGMDLAHQRLQQVNQTQAPILCLDADCTVNANYLPAVEAFFLNHPEAHAATLYYEHPLEGLSEEIYTGIVNYELFLRYYAHGLKWAGSPYGIQTVGSSMAVRANIYQKQGGMNRRKAGEDFYFLQKLSTLGAIPEITETTVFPSPRSSERVPFGTGQAINQWLSQESEIYLTYDPRSFQALKSFLELKERFYKASQTEIENLLSALPRVLQQYLHSQDVVAKIKEIQQHSTSLESFNKRFWFWFNGFQAMKFIHFARDGGYPNIPILTAIAYLFQQMGVEPLVSLTDSRELLNYFRHLDRSSQVSWCNQV